MIIIPEKSANSSRFVIGESDFTLGGSANNALPTWSGTGFGGTIGTAASVAGTANHPGIVQLQSAAAANSGYRFITGASMHSFLLAGGGVTEFIFYPVITSGSVIRLGWQDSTTDTAPVDGVWLNLDGTTLSGKTSNNSSASTTGTTYTVTASTWYRGKIVINSNATSIAFYLYSEAGAQLWTDALTTNIPTSTGRETGHGVVAYNTGSSAVNIVNMDYMSLYINRTLTR